MNSGVPGDLQAFDPCSYYTFHVQHTPERQRGQAFGSSHFSVLILEEIFTYFYSVYSSWLKQQTIMCRDHLSYTW